MSDKCERCCKAHVLWSCRGKLLCNTCVNTELMARPAEPTPAAIMVPRTSAPRPFPQPEGARWLVEHKTSSEDISEGSPFWQRVSLNEQVGIYLAAARSFGLEVSGMIYDVVRKPGLRPYEVNTRRSVAETPDEYGNRCLLAISEKPDDYYRRAKVHRLPHELKQSAFDLWMHVQNINKTNAPGTIFQNDPFQPVLVTYRGAFTKFYSVNVLNEQDYADACLSYEEHVVPELPLWSRGFIVAHSREILGFWGMNDHIFYPLTDFDRCAVVVEDRREDRREYHTI